MFLPLRIRYTFKDRSLITLAQLGRQKMQFSCFLPVLDQTSDNLTTVYVEPHRCLLHKFILLTQDQSLKVLRKNIENWRSWKNQFFGVGNFEFLWLHPHEDQLGFHIKYRLFLH